MSDDSMPLARDDAASLARSMRDVLELSHRMLAGDGSALARRLTEHLPPASDIVTTSITLATIERPSLQLALDDLASTATTWDVFGLPGEASHYPGLSIPTLAMGGPARLDLDTPALHESIEIGVGESIRCLRSGVIVAELDGDSLAVLAYVREHHRPELVVEIAGASTSTVERFLQRLRESMARLNVLRGKVVTFSFSQYGEFGLQHTSLPAVARDQVILPEDQLVAIEHHAFGITDVADELTGAGQHLRRGLLLYGPPGTGKTHTVAYLVSRMPDRTTIVLTGASVGAIGQAGTLARSLAPATIIVEDVDLIAMDRSLPGGQHNPLLFQLLNEMDGLQDDDDVLFIVTTNRADLLEPALAARPGRIDQAIEIAPPDADGRRALFDLYLDEPLGDVALAHAVDRTDGAAAAFIKELARRATFAHVREATPIDDAVTQAVDTMLDSATPLLRTALAAPEH